jgi:hypothetical protein
MRTSPLDLADQMTDLELSIAFADRYRLKQELGQGGMPFGEGQGHVAVAVHA